MASFTCISISPLELQHTSIASAVVSAGGVGILDREFCKDSALAQASQTLEQLLKAAVNRQAIGLRLRVDQIGSSSRLLEQLSHSSHWLVLADWHFQSLEQAIASLPSSQPRNLLLEVTNAEQVANLDPQKLPPIAGLIARGHESGGWVGEDSAFILLQKLLAMQSYPVYVQGGIGIHTASACRAVGAAGVVLDDQLWLMPESPLPEAWKAHLKNLTGQEAIGVGERLGMSCRVLTRPGFAVIPTLQKLAQQAELLSDPISAAQHWQQARAHIGWAEPGTLAYPIGQAVGFAADLRDRYQTTAHFVQALLKASETHIQLAQKLQPLKEAAPLAKSHGTQYPIVQGPMTRVSDTAEFAQAVAAAGGLPMLALALMRGHQVKSLLEKTRELLGDRPWGIGILGFVSQALREEQIAAVNQVKPSFALIAGGRPDQAAKFEEQGIAAYIHVPSPRLLNLFLEQGAKRFVFEGRECGGHVGPLSSFVLWESMIATLLEAVPAEKAADVHVLFAGGIHDARSAAMISVMAAPLAERGIRIGVLMGTAYLFTEEAVACGAILPDFQKQAIACERTINLETGPGHASRCAVTPFAEEFYAVRRQMLTADRPPEDIKATLEDLTLGRLRIASKGLIRGADGQLLRVDASQQQKDGMYMIGQVATLRNEVFRVRDLHQDVCQNSTHLLLAAMRSSASVSARSSQPSDIAIIGIGTLLPQAEDPETFWSNILTKLDPITEIPANRWDWRLYYDPDRRARDKIYSKWGGFIQDIPFDPLRFGIPPKSLKSIEPSQLLALEVVRRALADAGYESGQFDREHTSVILGAGGGIADLGQQFATRSEIPRFVDSPSEQVWDRLPEWTEETFPGLLLNVIAGRIANRFDLGGSNFTIDAACASSLAALDLAVQELESGRSHVVIAGGIDTVQSPFAYFCFSKTQALSPTGRSRSFDQSADGIAISEGLAVVVLKRLADAERDGDRIYAVIKAVAGSSDGKALGMTAPLPAGQMRAVRRAYDKAGFSPNTLGLYEAHGTGTPVGDRAELETIVSTLSAHQATSKSCALGSVKTMIGHTKATAGIAGLVKAVLALHHKVIPPHLHVQTPLEPILDPASPVYLPKDAQPWLAHPDRPRRAGVSAFGFGGTNFHAVLEEAPPRMSDSTIGAVNWPYELLVVRAADRQALAQEVVALQTALAAGASPELRNLAFTYTQRSSAQTHLNACLSVVVNGLPQLTEALSLAIAHLNGQSTEPLPPHIHLSLTAAVIEQPLAFLFPGQGSQYPDMVREVALYCPEMRQALEAADRQLRSRFPQLLSQYIYPPSAYSAEAEKQNQALLTNTQVAQPAIGAVAAGFMDLAARLGLKPTIAAGHSYGEYAALHCAGVLNREDFFTLSATRGQIMASACATSQGAMAAVQMTREALLGRLQSVANVVIANHNAPQQAVISGNRQSVQQVVDSLNTAGVLARMLPVSGAFHSTLVASAQTALQDTLEAIKLHSPQISVYANASARPYAADATAIRQQLAEHLVSPVRFVDQINAMYAAGARVLIELGPKSVLTNLVSQILADRPFTAVSLDGQGGGMRGFLIALARLTTAGVGMQLTALYAGRAVQLLDLSQLVESTQKQALSKTTWLVNGGSVRPLNAAVGYAGKEPPLTAERVIANTPLASTVQPDALLNFPEMAEVEPAAIAATDYKNGSATPAPVVAPILKTSIHHFVSMSQPSLPSNSSSPSTPSSPETAALSAYQSYQETMRQFLTLQEHVMGQFLNCIQLNQAGISEEASLLGKQPDRSVEKVDNGVTQPEVNRPGSTPHTIIELDLPVAQSGKVTAEPEPREDHLSILPASFQRSAVSAAPVEVPTTPVRPAPVVAQAVETSTSTSSSAAEIAQLTQMLVHLVSDRTGYPAEMLGLEQDLEAELGIDSIKRVEILGAFQKSLPPHLATIVQQQMESLTRVKSLSALVQQVVGFANGAVKEPTSLGKF